MRTPLILFPPEWCLSFPVRTTVTAGPGDEMCLFLSPHSPSRRVPHSSPWIRFSSEAQTVRPDYGYSWFSLSYHSLHLPSFTEDLESGLSLTFITRPVAFLVKSVAKETVCLTPGLLVPCPSVSYWFCLPLHPGALCNGHTLETVTALTTTISTERVIFSDHHLPSLSSFLQIPWFEQIFNATKIPIHWTINHTSFIH